MKGFSFSQKTKDSADIDALAKAFLIPHTTNSSLSSNSSTSTSSGGGGSSSRLSSLSHSLLPHKHPHGHHHHHHHSHHHSDSSSSLNQSGIGPGGGWLPNNLPTNPIEFVTLAFQLLLSVPGPTIKELKEDIIPLLFWDGYLHRANTREVGIDGLLAVLDDVLRARFKTLKFRVKNELIDNDGSATLKACAVGIAYDLVGTPFHAKGETVEERKTSVMAIVKVLDGRIAQTDLVIDTLPFQVRDEKELSCSIM